MTNAIRIAAKKTRALTGSRWFRAFVAVKVVEAAVLGYIGLRMA